MGGDPIEMQVFDSREPITERQDPTESQSSSNAPPLKRIFGREAIYAFSCILLITWEGCLVVLQIGLGNGGPAGVLYSFWIVWLGSLSTFATLSELTSMAPTSGGQYHYVSMLAPRPYEKVLSYFTGWLVLIGWLAFAASGMNITASIAQGVITLALPTSSFHNWLVALLTLVVEAIAVVANTTLLNVLPSIEPFILLLHVLGFIVLVTPLVWLGPHAPPSEVFATFTNGGGWSSMGVSFFVGLLGNVFALFGADGAIHLAEEVKDAATEVPRAILISLLLNGILGLGMLFAILFCGGDFTTALASSTDLPFIEICQQATQSTSGTLTMASVVMTLSFFSTLAIFAAASRTVLAFSRDLGFPYYKTFRKVNQGRPLWAVGFIAVGSFVLTLVDVGSTTAFADIISISVAALYSSYLLAAGLLLWRRSTGAIISMQETHFDQRLNMAGAQLAWGPWNLAGPLGTINNVFCCIYLTIVLFFSFWPSTPGVAANSFNYSSMLLAAILIFSVVYYVGWARKVYDGPLRRV